jgi:hypothetical protein
MRAPSSDLLGRVHFSRRPGAFPDLDVCGAEERTTPAQMLTRLGVLLAIALGFGVAAQVLVGLSH